MQIVHLQRTRRDSVYFDIFGSQTYIVCILTMLRLQIRCL